MFDDKFDDEDQVTNVYDYMISTLESTHEEHPPVHSYEPDIVWERKFPYPGLFNNYDAWLAELYGRNLSGEHKYLVGVHARFAEKVGRYLLLKKYGFETAIDLNLDQAVTHKLNFEPHVKNLRYDLSAVYQNENFEFDVKSRSNPDSLDLYINPSKLTSKEHLLFVRVFDTITEPTWEAVGFLTPEMLGQMFGPKPLNKLIYVPGYFAFNNTMEAYQQYAQKRNPVTAPLIMWQLQQGLKSSLSREEDYLVDEFSDVSQNPDVEYWRDLFRLHKKAG